MKSGGQRLVILIAVLASGLAGWWITRTASRQAESPPVVRAPPPPLKPLFDPAPQESKTVAKRPPAKIRRDDEAEAAGALKNQRSLRFQDHAAMERFLAAAKDKGIAILGSIDKLNALHVGFLSIDDLNALLDGSEQSGYIYPVYLPTPKTEEAQQGAVGMGDQLLAWLGVKGDNSAFGTGVKVGILDTGSTLPNATNTFLVNPPADAATWNGHGTAVADLIRQIAPAAELMSWRVADDNGTSNSFLLAQGLMAAIDAGVDVVNISMGSSSNSPILRDAVLAAQAAGIKIFASSGNDGYDQVSYPAAYAGVVAVGAVDANGTYLNFSNRGSEMMAPGLDLITQWTGGQSVYFTGTSAASPIAAGVAVATMSHGGTKLTADSAYNLMMSNLNDAGAPGTDSEYGVGNVDLGRVFQSGTPGIYDAAIAANYVTTTPNGQMQLQVTVQNRGTAMMVNTPVQVTTPAGTSNMNITTLKPGDVTTFSLPFNFVDGGAKVQSQVMNSSGSTDIKPSNNRRTDVYAAPSTP
ncbi:S8 family serine peptidase [Haloferula sp. BvORR071]|uniref:S8 family peptidase n=1 Tax=Haloferula sp. BvORR071 TaxID=1396141 RepID=UPI000696D473|nr:S8 family serine peptidase [Haloferula sp. BvORR071]